MHLATANSSFPSITAQILFQIGACHTPGKISYVPGSIWKTALGKDWLCAQGGALPKSSCQVHLHAALEVSHPGRAAAQGCAHSLLPHDKAAEATSLYQQLQEHCCLFLQHSPHKQQDFYCPISSSSYYLKNDSLGKEKAAWVIIYVKIIAGICSGWNIQSHPFSKQQVNH